MRSSYLLVTSTATLKIKSDKELFLYKSSVNHILPTLLVTNTLKGLLESFSLQDVSSVTSALTLNLLSVPCPVAGARSVS